MRTPSVIGFALGMFAATASASCFDPVHSRAVAELGEEQPGVEEGPTHRPGQPCTTCHGGEGPAENDFAFAGTVYQTRNGTAPLVGASISITDSNGVTKTLESNEAGNFYIAKEAWESVKLPVFVEIVHGKVVKQMKTRIGRIGGCAFCHYGADNEPTHMPPVFLQEAATP